VKNKKFAFTLVELLAVIGIIAILIALLIPALTTVKRMAKETQQRAQFTTIELAIIDFKDIYGDYPPSHGWSATTSDHIDYFYCGAQTLAEALVGWDLMGFHPDSAWRSDGKDKAGGNTTYDPDKNRDDDHDGVPDTLTERKGPFLNTATANVFRLGELFPDHASDLSTEAPDTFVICDVFGATSVTVGKKTVRAGAPILYYKANTSSKTIDYALIGDNRLLIYNRMDNYWFINSVKEPSDAGTNGLMTNVSFYTYIQDPKVSTAKWPSNPDSYLLISAGPDGLYGTGDDICNFDPNS
jgi:type II secretory pathway pseudopilin PulG